MLVLALFLVLKPPYQHTEALINNSVEPQAQKLVEAPKAQIKAVTKVTVKPEKPKLVKPVGRVSCEVYRPIVNKYNWDTRIAMQIMDAESSGGLDGICFVQAVGDTRVIGGIYAPSCGLFQIRTLAGRPTCEQLHDPELNVAWAYRLYQGRPTWVDWSVCKHIVRCY